MQLRHYQTTISEQALSLLVDFKIAYLAMQVRTGKTITAQIGIPGGIINAPL